MDFVHHNSEAMNMALISQGQFSHSAKIVDRAKHNLNDVVFIRKRFVTMLPMKRFGCLCMV